MIRALQVSLGKLSSIFALAVLSTTLCTGNAAGQSLGTDQADYAPGDLALIVGTGFTPGENVSLQVLHADGHPSDGEDHQPWNVVANTSGYVLTFWHVCEDDCVGALLRATAVGATSGLQASATFTDACRGGGIATVTGVSGTCVEGTPPLANGPYNWEVVEGGTYSMTLTGITACSGDAITVFLQNSSTGNLCFNVYGSSGTYTGTFTLPNPACNTFVISYKCGADAACDDVGAIAALGPAGTCSVQLRVSTFDAGCANPQPDTDCLDSCTCDGPPLLSGCLGCSKDDAANNLCSFFFELGCNPASVPVCDPNITSGDNCGPVPMTCHATDATIGCLHLRRVETRSSNDCGIATCVAAYVWTEDHAGPIMTCPSNANIDCGASTDPSHTGSAGAMDDCGDASTPTYSDSEGPGSCAGNRVITRTWTSVDGCGNSSSCVQTITITDSHGPDIHCPPDVSVGCGAATDPSHTGSATATDDCSGVAMIGHSDSNAAGNCAGNHVITRTWMATDNCGNSSSCMQKITVTDTTAPTIHCPGDISVNIGASCCVSVSLGTATATDDCSGATITNDAPPQFCVGNTVVTWRATDGCTNSSTCTQTVRVLGQICATKFYDANANGVRDAGEPGVAGWRMQLSGAASFSGLTGADGSVCFNVPAGNYTVSEGTPTQTNWVHTTAASFSVTIDAGHCTSSCSFGNYCFDEPSNGHTLGFWTNPNGQMVLASADPAWRTVINNLNLVDANGAALVVPTTGSFANAFAVFKPWMKGATATNMAYMLSAQLAATTLSVSYYGLSDSEIVVVPGGVKTGANVCIVPYLGTTKAITCGATPLLTLTAVPGSTACGCTSNDGLVTVGDLRARANCLLGAYPNSTPSSTQRTYQECVKDVLDMINNNGNNGYACGGVSQYINPGSGGCPATFPQ